MIDGPKKILMRKNFGAGVFACVAAGFIGLSGAAAQDKPAPRVGFVAGAGGYPKMAVTNQAFFDGLADESYKDESTMTVVFRTAEGMPGLINDVLAEKVDYLVVSSSPGCAAAQKATTTVPVLCDRTWS
jgi:putative ABC transport system substrate-binding protein